MPLESELVKSAYAFKVIIENKDNSKAVVGELLKLKITVPNTFGNDLAEVKCVKNRYFIDDIKIKDLPVGPKVKVQYCDGSKLEFG